MRWVWDSFKDNLNTNQISCYSLLVRILLPIEVALNEASSVAILEGFNLVRILQAISSTRVWYLAKKSSKFLFYGRHFCFLSLIVSF